MMQNLDSVTSNADEAILCGKVSRKSLQRCQRKLVGKKKHA